MRIQTMHRALIAVLLLAGVSIVAAPVSRVTNFSDGDVLTASQLNGEFNNVICGVNSINNAQIATNDAIAPSKLSAVIAGDVLERDASTGALSVKADDVGVEISGGNVALKDDGVTAAKIADDAVDTAQIVDDAVTTAKIVDDAVTQAKLGAANYGISSDCNTYTYSGTSYADITNLSVTITTTGRPVVVKLIGNANDSYVQVSRTTASTTSATLQFLEDGSAPQEQGMWSLVSPAPTSLSVLIPTSAFQGFFVPAAGSHTYKVQGKTQNALDVLTVREARLVAYEL